MFRPLLVLLTSLHITTALNILLFLIGTNQYERGTMESFAQQLALRHHTVVTVKPILIPEEPRLVKPKLHLVREKSLKDLLPKKMWTTLERAYGVNVWRMTYDYEDYMEPYYAAHNASCGRILNSDLFVGLAKDNLDVAIVYAGNPCQLAIAHVLGIPVIYFDQEGLTDETLVASQTPLNLGLPTSHCRSADMMSNPIAKRFAAAFCYFAEILAQSGSPLLASVASKRYRQMDGPISRQFADDYYLKKRIPHFPDVNTLKQQSSLFFTNTDPLLESTRALPSHVVHVGGLHIDHPKPLFAPWNETIQQSRQGTIVVSFGMQVNHSAMSEAQASAIFGALSDLTDYRIIWNVGAPLKLPGIDVFNTPSHINITSYLPQNDVLAHKSTKLLLTNGGMSSVMEAIAYGVPIVGLPLYGTNKQNLEKVVQKGLGLTVSKSELSRTNLLRTMRTVLDCAKFRTVAKDMSKEFKARRESALDRAVRHIEFVGRQRGGSFLRPTTNMYTLIAQLPFDMAVILFALFALPLAIAYSMTKRTLTLILSAPPISPHDLPPKQSQLEKENIGKSAIKAK